VGVVSWRAAALCWLLAALLGGAYVLSTPSRPVEPPMPVSPAMAPRALEPGPPAYELARKDVAAVEVRRGDRVVRWSAVDGGWRVDEPQGATLSRGLLDAFVDQLVDGATNERLDGEKIADTGLDRPALRVRVDETDGGRLTFVIGERLPTATAVYGKVEETDTVFVAGLNLMTYAELLFP
jgi:hypothetical protein